MRNARRVGLDLVAQAEAANSAVFDHAVREHRAVLDRTAQVSQALAEHGAQAMVTGQLLWVEFDTGRTEFINAGHVWPLLLRDGHVEEIAPHRRPAVRYRTEHRVPRPEQRPAPR